MLAITTVGLDVAKSVFQVHGIDARGSVLVRRQLKRRYVLAYFEKLPPCLVGIEACATSHHWSRELQALGQTVRLIFTAGALAVIRYAKIHGSSRSCSNGDRRKSRRLRWQTRSRAWPGR